MIQGKKEINNCRFKENYVQVSRDKKGQKLYKSETKIKESKFKLIYEFSTYLDKKKIFERG